MQFISIAYLKMNYQRVYDEIIERAKLRGLDRRLNIKMHKHHIKMKSLYDDRKLANIKENLVLLTPKEHFICHHLLFKIFPCHETQSAYWFMGHSKTGGTLSAKQYEQLKLFYNKDEIFNKFSRINKLTKSVDYVKKPKQFWHSWNKGKTGLYKHSEETKEKLRLANIGKPNSFIGCKHTEEAKLKMSVRAKTRIRKPLSNETKEKIRASLLGHHVSDETREKIKKAKRGVK